MVGAIVRKEFEWKEYTFKRGRLVLLDIYGMLHDRELWKDPHEFHPERFINWDGNPFTLIPQGEENIYTAIGVRVNGSLLNR